MSKDYSLLVVLVAFFFVVIISVYAISNIDFSDDLIDALSRSDTNVNGAVDVFVQDQTSFSVDLYAHTVVGSTTLASNVFIDDETITVSDSTGIVPGMAIGVSNDNDLIQSLVASVSGNVVTLSSPLDFDFSIGDSVVFGDWDFSSANGAVTPVVFYVHVPKNSQYDFYSVTLTIEDNSVMYESTFGGRTSLSRGLVGRLVDGSSKTFLLVTNNAGFRENGFTTSYGGMVPSGTYSFSGIKNIRTVNGVALRIDGRTDDYLEFIVRDDLTGLSKMAVSVHGHKVEN